MERDCHCHDQPSDSEQAGLEKSSAEAGEAVSAREGFITATFVWELNVKHQHPLDLALQDQRVLPRVPTPASSPLSPAACPACDSAQRLVILGNWMTRQSRCRSVSQNICVVPYLERASLSEELDQVCTCARPAGHSQPPQRVALVKQ